MDENQQQEAIERVLDAMMKCGWISSHAFHRSDEDSINGVHYTPLGAETMNRLKELVESLGGQRIDAATLSALIFLVLS
jgi:hypothetical protein